MAKSTPARTTQIKRMAKKLEEVWLKVPTWRMAQVFSNLLGPGPHDVFFPQDADWEKHMNDFLAFEKAMSKKTSTKKK